MNDFNFMTAPRTVEGLNNSSYFYYYNKLYKMASIIFKYDNVPDDWDMEYFKEHLYIGGYLVVTDTVVGTIPLQCGYSGLNVYGHATDFNVNNSVLGQLTGKIGVDGIIVFIQQFRNQYVSMDALLTRYATLLAEADASLQTTLINSRVAHIFSANSTAQMKAMQKTYDKISRGEPAVFIRKNPEEGNDHALFNNVKQSYIGQEIMDTKRSIMNEFMSEIGINNTNTQKKERLITAEAESNTAELNANIYLWYENIKKCIEKVNALYGLDITVEVNEDVLNTWQMDGGVQEV